MATNKKFTPRASSNLIDEGVAEDVVMTAEEETLDTPVADAPTDVVVDAPVDETPIEETTTTEENTDTVTFTAETDKKPIEKMVKIRLAKKYDGCIGGQWYHFAKDQVVTVPENVKRILNKAEGMLKPL